MGGACRLQPSVSCPSRNFPRMRAHLHVTESPPFASIARPAQDLLLHGAAVAVPSCARVAPPSRPRAHDLGVREQHSQEGRRVPRPGRPRLCPVAHTHANTVSELS